MKDLAKTRISGKLTIDDWKMFRPTLKVGGEQESWQQAAEKWFRKRLDTRYLIPIRVMRENLRSTNQGEGFAMIAILCSLVEFLESTAKGLNYRHVKRGD